jgi:hypothetical protein
VKSREWRAISALPRPATRPRFCAKPASCNTADDVNRNCGLPPQWLEGLHMPPGSRPIPAFFHPRGAAGWHLGVQKGRGRCAGISISLQCGATVSRRRCEYAHHKPTDARAGTLQTPRFPPSWSSGKYPAHARRQLQVNSVRLSWWCPRGVVAAAGLAAHSWPGSRGCPVPSRTTPWLKHPGGASAGAIHGAGMSWS